jgi:protein gp37
MAQRSEIEWTDATWNPVTGCTKVSPGCKNCYAERQAERFRGVAGNAYEKGFDLQLRPERLEATSKLSPLRWHKPKKIFVNSMSDLFHQGVPDSYVKQVYEVMREARRHTFQVLTKRPERLAPWYESHPEFAMLPNVWIGVSIEDRSFGLPRIPILKPIPAVVRFLSVEPLLEDLGKLDLSEIDWVIVGGESGPGARPMKPEWATSIRDQCVAAKVPFFFKQWGGVQKKRAGRLLEGRTWDEFPLPRRPR